MQLQTLGGLALKGHDFRRLKPLLLLCYLALEGPKERRHLAELFWPEADNGLASLSTALYRLTKSVPQVVAADEVRVWTAVETDVQALLTGLEQGASVTDLYTGAFLDGVYLPGWSSELEEWVYERREWIAGRVREALLERAEADAALGNFAEAALHAEGALLLPGAAELDPEVLGRVYPLLVAGGSAYAADVCKQAQEYDVSLSLSVHEAKAQLRQVFVGREQELERLSALEPGGWAWICGGQGIGKTSLLQRLPGRYLRARGPLPFAALEPLVGALAQEGEPSVLRGLQVQTGLLCLDDWEQLDTESRKVLTRFKTSHGDLKVVVASSEAPPFAVDMFLELSYLPRAALSAHRDVWERTGGVPRLVGAHLRGEGVAAALGATLTSLSTEARQVYLSLALLEDPDLPLVRRALTLSASDMVQALEALYAAGLAEPSGRVWPKKLARAYLDAHPTLLGDLALRLARLLEAIRAFPLFEIAQTLWKQGDVPAVQKAYLAWAEALLQRGFPKRAADCLAAAPPSDEVTFKRSYALERAEQFKEALDAIAELPETLEVLALKGVLLWRLGQPESAQAAAERALDGTMWARATALNTLGNLARTQGDYKQALVSHRKAAALWQGLGNQAMWAGELSNIANVRCDMEEAPEKVIEAYQEALEAAGENRTLQTRILINLALEWERKKEVEEAARTFETAIAYAKELGLVSTTSLAWNNLGAMWHRNGQSERARHAYLSGLEIASKEGEPRVLGMLVGNLAELSDDLEVVEEALRILETSGNKAIAARYRAELFE